MEWYPMRGAFLMLSQRMSAQTSSTSKAIQNSVSSKGISPQKSLDHIQIETYNPLFSRVQNHM